MDFSTLPWPLAPSHRFDEDDGDRIYGAEDGTIGLWLPPEDSSVSLARRCTAMDWRQLEQQQQQQQNQQQQCSDWDQQQPPQQQQMMMMHRVSSCYFSAHSEGSNSWAEFDLLSVLEEEQEEQVRSDQQLECACSIWANAHPGEAKHASSASSSSLLMAMLPFEIFMLVFDYLDTSESLRHFSETARLPNQQVFHYLQLTMEHATSQNSSFRPSQPHNNNTRTHCRILHRLAALDESAAQGLVQEFIGSNNISRDKTWWIAMLSALSSYSSSSNPAGHPSTTLEYAAGLSPSFAYVRQALLSRLHAVHHQQQPTPRPDGTDWNLRQQDNNNDNALHDAPQDHPTPAAPLVASDVLRTNNTIAATSKATTIARAAALVFAFIGAAASFVGSTSSSSCAATTATAASLSPTEVLLTMFSAMMHGGCGDHSKWMQQVTGDYHHRNGGAFSLWTSSATTTDGSVSSPPAAAVMVIFLHFCCVAAGGSWLQKHPPAMLWERAEQIARSMQDMLQEAMHSNSGNHQHHDRRDNPNDDAEDEGRDEHEVRLSSRAFSDQTGLGMTRHDSGLSITTTASANMHRQQQEQDQRDFLGLELFLYRPATGDLRTGHINHENDVEQPSHSYNRADTLLDPGIDELPSLPSRRCQSCRDSFPCSVVRDVCSSHSPDLHLTRTSPSGCVGTFTRLVTKARTRVQESVRSERRSSFEGLPELQRQIMGTTLIDACCSDDNLGIVTDIVQTRKLIDVEGFYVGSDGTETCALHAAAFHGSCGILEYLCRGLVEDQLDQQEAHNNKSTSFSWDGGLCNINLKDSNGWTALHFAAGSNSVQAVQILAQYGADLNLQAVNGYTPLQWAQRLQNTDVANALRERIVQQEQRHEWLVRRRRQHQRASITYWAMNMLSRQQQMAASMANRLLHPFSATTPTANANTTTTLTTTTRTTSASTPLRASTFLQDERTETIIEVST